MNVPISARIPLRADFVRDLHEALEHFTEKPLAPSAMMIAGLDDSALHYLDKTLSDAHRQVTQEIYALHESHRAALPDSPLFCPVTLLGPIDSGRWETAVTRALAWLFNPRAEHGFETAAIDAVMSALPGGSAVVGKFPAYAQAEHFFNRGRIDVLVKWQLDISYALVIEAKIDAAEQPQQAARYETFAQDDSDHHWLLYLTPDGRKPSTGKDRGNVWHTASYTDLVAWLLPVVKHHQSEPGLPFLRLFLSGLLKDVCGWDIKSDGIPSSVNRFVARQLLSSVGEPE